MERSKGKSSNQSVVQKRQEAKQQIVDLLKYEEDDRKLEVIRQILIRN